MQGWKQTNKQPVPGRVNHCSLNSITPSATNKSMSKWTDRLWGIVIQSVSVLCYWCSTSRRYRMLFRQSADIIIKGPPQTGRLFVLGAASERDGRPLKKRKKKKGRLQSQYCDQVLYEVAFTAHNETTNSLSHKAHRCTNTRGRHGNGALVRIIILQLGW